MTKFEEQRKAKFERGAKEHKQKWSLEEIDAIDEAQQECLDLFSYGDLMTTDSKLKHLGEEVKSLARYLWKRIEYRDKQE